MYTLYACIYCIIVYIVKLYKLYIVDCIPCTDVYIMYTLYSCIPYIECTRNDQYLYFTNRNVNFYSIFTYDASICADICRKTFDQYFENLTIDDYTTPLLVKVVKT